MNNWNVGDKIVCTCGGRNCPRFFTVTEVTDREIVALDDLLNEEYFNHDYKHLIPRELYDSPLYKALR